MSTCKTDSTWERRVWLPALAALDPEELAAGVDPLMQIYSLEHQALPEDGLGLLTLRDGAMQECFYLGEFPVASAHILVQAEDGQSYPGAAQYLGDQVQKAVHMALCDAILAHNLPGHERIQVLVRTGLARRQGLRRQRGAMLERTRVDFDLVSTSQGGTDVD